MLKLTIFASLLLGAIQPAFAQTCSELKSLIAPSVYFLEKTADCSFAKNLTQTLDKVASFYSPAVPVTLVIRDKGTNASFDNGHIIWIPRKLYFSDNLGQDFDATYEQLQSVVVHEYGHAVLNIALKNAFSNELGDLYKGFEKISITAEENVAMKITSRGIRVAGGALAQTPEFALYFKHIPAYSELFADALTVIFFQDPTAMKTAMSFASLSGTKVLNVQLRDFGAENSLADIVQTNDPHTTLSLVRSYLGKRMQGLDLEGRRLLLDQLQTAIVRAIAENMRATKEPSIEEMNKRLIELLQESANQRYFKNQFVISSGASSNH